MSDFGSVNTGTAGSRRPSASKAVGEWIVSASTATDALALPVASVTCPTAGVINTRDFPMVRLIIAGSDAENETINYQVIAWTEARPIGKAPVYIPQVVASGLATLGASALPADILASNGKIADTITETLGYAGTVVRSPANDGVATLDIDCRNAKYIQVQTDLGTAATAYVLGQLGENVGAFADIDASIASTGLATSAHQVTQNTAQSTLKAATDLLAASGGGAYVRQDSTATIAKESGGNLATVKSNTDSLVTAGGGGYVRQDSTATIAKETGGNLATVATAVGTLKAATDLAAASGGGMYIRQDSTGTIAKDGSLTVASYYKSRTALTGAAQTIAFTTARRHVRAWLDTGSSPSYLSLTAAAANTDPRVEDNMAWARDMDSTGASNLYVLGTGAIGYINVEAW